MKKQILTFLACCPWVAANPVHGVEESAHAKATRPNMIVILSDDMGWNDPGFNGGDAELTPSIDSLRKQGASLTSFYVHSVCAPTRSALLTGKYSFRTWTDWRSEDFGKPCYLEILGMTLATNEDGEKTRRIHAMAGDEWTLAEALKMAGYFTAITGKWHLGEWLPEHLPMGQGFMHQYGHYGWGIDYTNYTIPHNAPATFAVYDWHRNQQPLAENGYSTDLIANEAVRLIADHKQDPRSDNGRKPFFIYVAFNAIHGPLESIPRYNELGKRAAALKCLDEGIGTIVGAVDQHGYTDGTLIVFMNDNGGLQESMNSPYRGNKNTNYEGGVKVPCVIRWPGMIQAGSTNDGLMHVSDFYNTIIHLGGAALEPDHHSDGMDMRRMLLEGAKSKRDEIIFDVAGCVRLPTIRKGDYKLMGKELYNLKEDPYEKKDIAGDRPEVVAQLSKRLEAAAAERPPMPDMSILMTPALPWIYGRDENANAPEWVKEAVRKVRATQPQSWPPGETPWPQAPKDGRIEYTGDGR
jgi:arylsulfatase A-like enzyme